MKGAFLILAGGILFTGVFISGAICGGWLVYEAVMFPRRASNDYLYGNQSR